MGRSVDHFQRPGRWNCCSNGEPRESCDLSQAVIPDHPSSPSRRVLTCGEIWQAEILSAGCSVTADLRASDIGRHPFALSVAAQQPLWTALLIVWFDMPDGPIDSHVIGSLTSVQAGTQIKIRDALGWPEADTSVPISYREGPWLIAGAAVQQAGQIYVAPRLQLLNLIGPDPCCWSGIGGGGTDSLSVPCRATRHAFRSEVSTAIESVAGGSGWLSSDYFGVLSPSGEIDLDDRPDFDLHATEAVTRVGFCLGLSSCPWDSPEGSSVPSPGAYTIAGITGPLCGQVVSAGSPYTAGPTSAPTPPGTMIIDESLDSVPVGWSTTTLGRDDDGTRPEGGGNVAVFTSRDGGVFAENTHAGEYRSGTLSTDIPIARTDWVDGTTLTIEWTHRRVQDADRRYPLPGSPDPIEYRNQTCGVFVGGLFRWMMRHENAARFDEGGNPTPRYGWRADAPVHPLGGIIATHRDYAEWPPEWPYDTATPPDLPAPVQWQLAGEDAFDGRHNGGCSLIAPNDGDRVTLVLTLAIEQADNPYTAETATDEIAVWRWSLATWINGRLITPSTPVSTSGGSWIGVPPESLRIGLCALYGGGWSHLRVWLH